jgi:hypothetical protein
MPGGKSLFFNTSNSRTTSGGNRPLMARGGELLSDLALCPIILPDNVKQAMALASKEYSKHLATKQYDKIPFDVGQYASMVSAFSEYETRVSQLNPDLAKLMSICEDVVVGSVNALFLKNSNTDYAIKQAILQKQIDTILSEKNVYDTNATGSGEISLRRQFKLAPIYSLYLYVFGLPAPGVGFEMAKLERIRVVMDQYQL